MGRPPRNREAERRAIQAAADRLLAGTPLRATASNLTVTALIAESGLRRDIVYEHPDLVDGFKARVQARHSVPEAMRELTDRCAQLGQDLKAVKAELAQERQTSAYLRRVVVELSIDLEQARQEQDDEAASTVTRIRSRRAHQFHTRPG